MVNTPHLAANADNMHREEDGVNTDETQQEMNLAERFVHEAAEHLGEPEIHPRECREQGSDRHHKVEVGHQKKSILELNTPRRFSKKNPTQTAAHKHRHES